MYDELVKDLRENHDKYFARDMEAADAIEELSRENESLAKSVNEASEILRRRWIPVEERLPNDHESVLVYNQQYQITVGYIYGGGQFRVRAVLFPETPTYWMPLPPPPKEGES